MADNPGLQALKRAVRNVYGGGVTDEQKQWVRDAALRLVAGVSGPIAEADMRDRKAYAAVATAAALWDQTEARYAAPQKEAED